MKRLKEIKAITAFILAVALISGVLNGCGSGDSSQTTAARNTGNESGTETEPASTANPDAQIVVDLVAEPVSTDPTHVTDINSMRILYLMYDRLVDWDTDGFNMIPSLAESWEMSDDALSYTFHLRKDAKFHDGSAVNAEAVVFSFERQLDENHEFAGTGPFPNAATYFANVTSVEALDDYTVKFTLDSPKSAFLAYLTTLTASIVSPDTIAANASDTSMCDAGSGVYSLDHWTKGVELALVRNDNYWGEKAKNGSVVFVPVTEGLVRATNLQTGQADIVADVDPDSIAAVEASGAKVEQQSTQHLWYVGLNCQKAPFDNELVRQAVNYAIDKEAIVNDILKGTGVVATQPLAPVTMGYDETIKGYDYDPEKAKELLAEAGYPDGFTVTYYVPESGSGMQSPVAMSTAIQGYLSDVGITCNMVKLEWGTFLNQISADSLDGIGKMDWDMFSNSLMNTSGDTDVYLPRFMSIDGIPKPNRMGYINEEATDLMREAAVETDSSKREELYKEANRLCVENPPVIYVDWGNQIAGVASGIGGFQLHPSQMMHLEKVTK